MGQRRHGAPIVFIRDIVLAKPPWFPSDTQRSWLTRLMLECPCWSKTSPDWILSHGFQALLGNIQLLRGPLRWWPSRWRIGLQCRRHRRLRFDRWVGKIRGRRKWQPTPAFLPEKSHGQRSLAGYSPKGYKELDTSEWLNTPQNSQETGNFWGHHSPRGLDMPATRPHIASGDAEEHPQPS